MPIVDRKEARESGFAQVREAMLSFVGDVVSAEFGQWGGKLLDEDTGKPIPPKEFLEVSCVNVEVLEVTEELAMAIDEWNFRVNCSNFRGSFWVEDFLESADRAKLLIPDDLVGKRITWKKVIRTWEIRGKPVSYSNYVIDKVAITPKAAPRVVSRTPTPVAQAVGEVAAEGAEESSSSGAVEDPMELALELAVGKTETQFRSAVSLHPKFVNSPLLPLAKAGAITQALVKDGKLIEVQEGNKTIYQKTE